MSVGALLIIKQLSYRMIAVFVGQMSSNPKKLQKKKRLSQFQQGIAVESCKYDPYHPLPYSFSFMEEWVATGHTSVIAN